MAKGVFAPGHLGELTRIVPFEMVDAVLAECGAVQGRLRKLPARVVVYLLLAAALFEDCGDPAVWSKLGTALGALPVPKVTATALWHARARLGVRPLRALFDLVRGPASAIRTTGARWAGLLVVAIDGTFLRRRSYGIASTHLPPRTTVRGARNRHPLRPRHTQQPARWTPRCGDRCPQADGCPANRGNFRISLAPSRGPATTAPPNLHIPARTRRRRRQTG